MRRLGRIILWTLSGTLVFAAALVAFAVILGNTGTGRTLIEYWVPKLTDGVVRPHGLSGNFPSAIDLNSLEIADDSGVWLTAQGIRAHWTPIALLIEHVRVADIEVAHIRIDRRPLTHPSAHKEEVHIPDIDVRHLTVGALVLEPALAGVEASLSVHGAVHLKSLHDASGNLIAHRTNGLGDYEVAVDFSRARMDGTVQLKEPASGPLEHVIGLPELGALSVTASLTGPRSAERVDLRAQAGAITARVDGSLNLIQSSGDLAFQFDSPALSLRPWAAWQRVALQGEWHGGLVTPRAASQLRIEGLELPDGSRVALLNANLSARAGSLAVQARAEGLALPGPVRALLADSPLEIDATTHLNDASRPVELTAHNRWFALRALATTAAQRHASFTLDVLDLTPLATLTQISLRGTAAVNGQLALDSHRLRVSANVVTGISGGASPLAALLGRSATGRIAGSIDGSTIDLEQLTLSTGALSVSAEGTAQRAPSAGPVRTLHGHWNARIAKLNALAPALSGTLVMDGQLSGSPAALATEFEVNSVVAVRGSPPGTVRALVVLRGLPAAISGTVRAQGVLAGSPLGLDASLGRGPGDQFHLNIERTDWRSVHAVANLTAGAQLAEGRGSMRLRIANLADLQPLIGAALAGSVEGTLALRPDGRQTQAQLQLDAHDLALASLTTNGQLTARGPIDALDVHLDAQSTDADGELRTVSAVARLNALQRTLQLERLDAKLHGRSLRLLAPARVEFSEGLRTTDLRLGMQDAIAEINGEIAPRLDLHASLRDAHASLINSIAPGLLAQGAVAGDAQLRGTLAAPVGQVSVALSGLRAANAAARDLPAVNAHASADLNGDVAQIHAQLTADQNSKLEVSGSAPLHRGPALNLTLSGKLEAALANAFLEAHGQRAAGLISVDASVTGPIDDPEIGGTVDLAAGDLRDYAQGVHISDVTAHLVGGKGILSIATLSGKAGSGSLSVTGTIGVLEPHLPIDIALTAKNAEPITSDILTANVDAAVTVKGTLRRELEVAGSVYVKRATVGIPNSLPPNVQMLDVRRAGAPPPPPPEHPVAVRLDLTLSAPQSIFVEGRGLNAQLGGTLTLRGTTAVPRVNGGFELYRGSFTLASSRLNFTSGEVSFNGAGLHERIDPTLNFTAQANTSDATVLLRITGFADAPKFDLSSTPPMPQDEILARLLFGEPASQLTALQAAETAAALVSLGGGGAGLNPLAQVQKVLGLSTLTVGSAPAGPGGNAAQSQGASITAGRYVTNRVYVAGTHTTTGTTQLEVDVDLTKHLKLQTRLGNGTTTTQGITPENDPGSSVGLLWNFDY